MQLTIKVVKYEKKKCDDRHKLDHASCPDCGLCIRSIIKSNAWNVDGNYACVIQCDTSDHSCDSYGAAWHVKKEISGSWKGGNQK